MRLPGGIILVGGLLATALLAAGLSRPSCAEGLPQQQRESGEKSAIREVLKDPVFGGEKEEMEWRYIRPESKDEPGDSKTPSWIASLQDLIESLSQIFRLLVWVGGALLIAALIYFSYRYRDAWLGSLKPRAAPPEFLFGLDVRPESLPDDVVAAALAELAKGSATGALSLLYRAALVSLIHRSQLDFHAGATEDDCLRVVRAAVDAGCSGYFAQLLEAWKLAAYADESPPAPALESLCHGWGAHFARVEAPR